jgi:hypothetical protein
LVGIDIDYASKKLDLSEVVTSHIPSAGCNRRTTLAVRALSTQFFDSRRNPFVGFFNWYAARMRA